MSGSSQLLYSTGDCIDVPELLGLRRPGPAWEGKARLSIIYLAHLSPDEQQLFLSLLFSSMSRWMLSLDGSLAGLLYIDEVAPFCPPVRKPPAKQGLINLLKQARKYGLCLSLATQSPGDLDYKALGNIGTVALGRVTQRQDIAKIEGLLRSMPNIDSQGLVRTLPAQRPGEFILVNNEHLAGPTSMRSRWLATEHRLVTDPELRDLVADEDRVRLGGMSTTGRLTGVA